MSERRIVVYGAGAQAREIAWLAADCSAAGDRARVVALIDDEPATHGRLVDGIEIMGLETARQAFADATMIIGIGSSAARQLLAARAADAGFAFATLVHPRAEIAPGVTIGEGTIVCAGSIISVNATIGRHVHVNLGCSISHDAVIGDFATLAPRVTLAGYVHVGHGAWLGVGSVVSNGTAHEPMTIGEGAVVGASACVLRSVAPGTTVVGVPARPVRVQALDT